MTLLCVPIFVTDDIVKLRGDAMRACELGADILELRLDEIANADDLQPVRTFLRNAPLPCIVTCRPEWEGGRSTLDDSQRWHLLQLACEGQADYVDFELAASSKVDLKNPPRPLILSAHDFAGRPARLSNLVLSMDASVSEVNKFAWTARSIRDNIEAFELLQGRVKPTIALCMGEAGLISRVLAKKFDAFLTFASLDDESGTAPGQITIEKLKRLYRWDALGPHTKLYGVVGSPVAHSMSPAIHNAAFERVGHDGVYLPLLVNPGYESFKAFMESFLHFTPVHLSGLSVTIPHKENALRYLKERGAEVEELAERIGAVNTIVIDRLHNLRGFNTDYAAILDTLTAALNISRAQLAGYRVAVIGAGGTGRTAVAALAHYGATVVVYNRTVDRAAALAAEFTGRAGKVVAAPMQKLCDSCCQIYINTTSLGMHPNVDGSPFGDKLPALTAETLVFDAVYNPPMTRFLSQARAAGARTIGGMEMLVRQAASQFNHWTGLEAPMELMQQVVRSGM